MTDENGRSPDPEMSKQTELKEDPQASKPTMNLDDPEMAIHTAERPAPGGDPGSIEFQVESVGGGESPRENEPAGHVVHVDALASGIGDTGGPRYELHDELGAGGMAVVNAAHDRQLQRSVAIKRLRKELASSPRNLARFYDEALVIASLDHPGVVPIFEKGTLPNGEAFYSMKKVSGRTLEEMISRRAPEEIGSREGIAHYIDIFERICQTMAAAHLNGVVHRDLKPSNVMVDDFGSVLVMDWGLAKKIGEDGSSESKKTVAGALLGTPSYMSPEQAKGLAHKSDSRSDVFSLGVMLFEILTGQNPFDRTTVRESLDQVLHFEPQSPRDYNPMVDRDLAAICMKAIAKDPVHRYLSARDFADDIRRYREFRQVSARKPGMMDRIGRWSRRNPRLGGALVALVLMAAVIGGAVVIQHSNEARLVDEAFAHIEQTRKTIDGIDKERAEIVAKLESSDLTDDERTKLQTHVDELDVEREYRLDDEEAMAVAITGFTVLRPDEEAREILRKRVLEKIDSAMQQKQWHVAKLEIEGALQRAKGRNILGWSAAEIAALGEKLGEVKQASRVGSLE